MAKKNEDIPQEKVLFKRPNTSLNLSMGIVGLPNVGKSTLFNKLTNGNVPAENFPFCTINPSIGHVMIDDPRVKFLADVYKPKKVINAVLTITDIAGLVKGASEGLGLGNKFLDHIRNVDGIFLVVRCFEDKEVPHVEVTIDPLRDIEVIFDELRIKDKDFIASGVIKAEKDVRTHPGDKKYKKNLDTMKRLLNIIETRWIKEDYYDSDEMAVINTLNLLTTKNVVILANISAKHYKEKKCNKHLKVVIEKFKESVIPFSAKYIDENGNEGLPKTFVEKLVKKGYESLRLINYFTVGKDEVRSWTIGKDLKAPSAGAAIHTDFEKYFISVDVMEYEEFVKNPSEAAMRSIGKYLQKGKEYIVKDGNILHFKINAPKTERK